MSRKFTLNSLHWPTEEEKDKMPPLLSEVWTVFQKRVETDSNIKSWIEYFTKGPDPQAILQARIDKLYADKIARQERLTKANPYSGTHLAPKNPNPSLPAGIAANVVASQRRKIPLRGRTLNYVFPSIESYEGFRSVAAHLGIPMTRIVDGLIKQFMQEVSTEAFRAEYWDRKDVGRPALNEEDPRSLLEGEGGKGEENES